MYRSLLKKSVLMACGMLMFGTAYANTDLTSVKPDTVVNNISQQALDVAQQVENMGEVVADIRTTLRGRVAGIYAEYDPKFTVVVRLKGNGSPPKKAYDLAAKHPIRYETGSQFTVEELVESYDRHFEQIKALVPSVQGIGTDEKNGQIVISILDQDDKNNQAKNQIKKLLGKPVRFQVQASETMMAGL